MIEYLAVEEQSSSELTCEVNRMLKEGWHPVGGVAIAGNVQVNSDNDIVYTTFSFHQALIRSIPDDEPSVTLQCRECSTVIRAKMPEMEGWYFTTARGWRCPRCSNGNGEKS